MRDIALLLGRVLMAAIFVWSGFSKLTHYDAVQPFIVSLGMPGWFLVLIILWELGGGLLLLLGAFTRPVALALAVFCLVSGFLVHLHPEDQGQMINFMKNVAMAGGYLAFFVAGAGAFSLDHKLRLKWA